MREVTSRRAWLAILGALLASSVFLNFIQQDYIQKLRLRPPSTELDQQYIDRAVIYWALKTGTTPRHAMRERYAKVIYIGDEACVSIENETGGVGGEPVYCFDVHTKKLVRKADDVE